MGNSASSSSDGRTPSFNHDVHVPEEFLRHFPRIASVLHREETAEALSRENTKGMRAKRRFHQSGLAALFLGTLALCGSVVEISCLAGGIEPPSGMAVAVEVAALLAFCLLLGAWSLRYRRAWLVACFTRERIRQWHFQTFLNGELVEKLAAGDPDARSGYERSWAAMVASFGSDEGAMSRYKNDRGVPRRLLHGEKPYTDPQIAADVHESLVTLRIRHQREFAERKLNQDDASSIVSLVDKYKWAEAVARMTFLVAIVTPAAQLAVIALHERGVVPGSIDVVSVVLLGVALLLAVISAGSRAFLSAMSLPAEIDSYREWAQRLEAISGSFEAGTTMDDERTRQLRECELACAEELQRFLRMKSDVRFW